MQLRLLSTLIRWTFSSKTYASIWKRYWKWIKTKTHTYRISVERTVERRMKTKTENIAGACVYSMRIESNLRHNVILSFSQSRSQMLLSFWSALVSTKDHWPVPLDKGNSGSGDGIVVFERSRMDSRKRIRTVACTRIDRCVFDDNENALV